MAIATLIAAAVMMPAQAAEASLRPDFTGPPVVRVTLTDAEAGAASLSAVRRTVIQLPTGGTVVVTPGMAVERADDDGARKTKRRWFGIQVYFNRRETNIIGFSAGACTLVVGNIPMAGPILAAYCGALSLYAGYLSTVGRCLRATVFWGSVAPLWGSHRGRYCR